MGNKKILQINTKEDAIKIVKRSGAYLEVLPEKYRDDKEVVKIAVENLSLALEYASDRLKDDEEIVLIAIKKDPRMLTEASPRLADDDKMRQIAFSIRGGAFIVNKYASKEFERLDNKMIKETTCVKELPNGSIEEVYDEEKMENSPFYQRFKRYYEQNPLNPITAKEIRSLEAWLLERREKRILASIKSSVKPED